MRLLPPTAPAFGIDPHFGVPGGMCGVPYDQRISVPAGWHLKRVFIDERCGVHSMASEPGHLIGTPVSDGTYLLRLECADPSGATVVGEARLVISRDPRNLWRNVPSDPTMPYWKPDNASQRVECQGWRAYAISRRGRSHANAGKCREDDVVLRVVGEQMIVTAVADGAGSAVLSRLGSHLAVMAAMRVLEAQQPRLDLSPHALQVSLAEAARAAQTALQETAAHLGRPATELATTLLLCVVVPVPQPLIACLQIGDGVIAACSGISIGPLSAADRGEYANQTVFLSPASVAPQELAARIHVQQITQLRWVLVATDGLSDPYLETEQALHDAQCWVPLAVQLEQAIASVPEAAEQSLTQWLDAFTPGHHDDRTLVLLHAPGAAR